MYNYRGNTVSCPHGFFYPGGRNDCNKPFSKKKNVEKPCPLLALPPNLFRYVFSYLSFEEIGYIRIVCRRFSDEGRRMLNQEAARIFDECADTKRLVKYKLAPRRPTDRVVKYMWDRWVYTDVAEIRLRELVRKVYARHVSGKRCCFASGKVLDNAGRFLKYEKQNRDLNNNYDPDDKFYDLISKLEESCEEAKGYLDSEDESEDHAAVDPVKRSKRQLMKVRAKKRILSRIGVLSKKRMRIRRMNRALEIRIDDLKKRVAKVHVEIPGEEAEWEDYHPPRQNNSRMHYEEDYMRCFDDAGNYYKWWDRESDYGVGYFRGGYNYF